MPGEGGADNVLLRVVCVQISAIFIFLRGKRALTMFSLCVYVYVCMRILCPLFPCVHEFTCVCVCVCVCVPPYVLLGGCVLTGRMAIM